MFIIHVMYNLLLYTHTVLNDFNYIYLVLVWLLKIT
jgi:hypothetical protein